jgi:AcrR family transcriptional regulator
MNRSQAEKLADLISATLACADELGTDGVRLRDVADRAGVSKTWILSVYPSRSALIAFAVGDRFSKRVGHSIDLMTEAARQLDSAAAFIGTVEAALGNGGHVLEREEVWQFFEVLVWSIQDAEVSGELGRAKKRLVAAYERLTAALDDRGWLHPDVGPISAAVLLMASSLSRVRLGSKEATADEEESLLLVTLNALLREQIPGVQRPEQAGASQPPEASEDPAAPAVSGDVVAERILAAAMKELAERGALEFGIRAVMESAGVSTTLIYKHFESRTGLIEQAADRLKTLHAQSVRESLTNALEPTVSAIDAPGRERMILATDAAYRSLRSNTPEAFFMGLTSLVSGRRVESDDDSERRRNEYYATVAQVFIQQLVLPASFDPSGYVDIGPLAFYAGVVLVSFPEDLDSEISLGPSMIRIVESVMSLKG